MLLPYHPFEGFPNRLSRISSPITSHLQVAANDEDDSHISSQSPHHQPAIPNSPPPSFRSRASSRRTSAEHDPQTEVERSLTDAFAGSPDDESDDEQDDSRRLVNDGDRSPEQAPSEPRPGNMQRRVTQLPVFTPSASRPTGRIYGGGNSTTDGVFANISAKPTRGEELEEKPPVRSNTFTISRICGMTNMYSDIRTSRRGCDTALLGNHNSRPWRHKLR